MTHSWHGTAHNVASAMVFLALPVLCFVLAVRFASRPGQRLWAVYSAVSGVAVLALVQGLGVEGVTPALLRLVHELLPMGYGRRLGAGRGAQFAQDVGDVHPRRTR